MYGFQLYYSIGHSGAYGAIVIVVRNGQGDQSSNLDEAVCTSRSTNILEKGMNPTILQLWKIVGQTRLVNLGMTTSLGEGKLWIRTC